MKEVLGIRVDIAGKKTVDEVDVDRRQRCGDQPDPFPLFPTSQGLIVTHKWGERVG